MQNFKYSLVIACVFSIFAMGQLQARDFEGANSVSPNIQSSEPLVQNLNLTANVENTLFAKSNIQKQVFKNDCDKLAMGSFDNWMQNHNGDAIKAMSEAKSDYKDCMGDHGYSPSGSWGAVKASIVKNMDYKL